MLQRSNLTAANAFRDYLREKDLNTTFEDFAPDVLDKNLAKFYMEARRANGQLYQGSSLHCFRYAINRYMKAPPHKKMYDIVKDPAFTHSNDMFKVAMKELKAEGKGEVHHHPPIPESDRKKLYSSMHFNPHTPCGLANKVQFDVRLYFFRRGMENLESMTKDTFTVKEEPNTGRKYVTKQKDELTKNHRADDKEGLTAVMMATGTEYCPVSSFESYISKLNPKCQRLWQYPSAAFAPDESCWFDNKPLGANALRKFMPKMSKLCHLSQIYTNHSIRATGATILAGANFSPVDIMAVTGHKSVNSLATYQKTSTDRKLEMAATISQGMEPHTGQLIRCATGAKQQHGRPTPSSSTVSSRTATVTAHVATEELNLTTEDIERFFSFENEPEDATRREGPIFSNCSIGTVNIFFKK